MSSPQKISQLTTAGPLTGAELVPIVQNGGTLQTTVSVLAAFAVVSISPVVSALQTQIDQVSALAASFADSITSLSGVVATYDARIDAVSATAVSLASSVSALEVRVSAVSATGVANSASITSVNAVVSTKANRVGDYLDSVQYIEFDTSTSFAASVGRLTWDITHGTLDLGLVGGNANLLLGQREVVYCFNNSAATLVKGKVVKVTGASGQKLTVDLAQADSDMDSATILGVMLEDVSVNASGFVATDGVVNNVNTGAFTDGQIVYLSPVSAGELTVTKPIAPQHLVQMGYVVKGGSVGGGSVYIKVQNGYEIGELHDVKTSSSTSLADGEVLAYNTSAGVWTNSTALINTQASVSALNIQVATVSALTSVNAAAITSTNNAVSALEVRVSTLEAAVSNIGNVSAISALVTAVASLQGSVSALEVRVSTVSAAVSALDIRVAAVSASVSALQIQINDVSAALTSTNNVVSVLEIRVSAVSAAVVSANAVIAAVSALTSVNAVAIAAVSALVSANTVAIAAVSASVSALQVQVDAVSAAVSAALVSVGQRVLKAGDSMTGELNMQDNLVTRPKFKDYALVAVIKGNVSAVTTLDMLEGNYFMVTAAGSTSFVFANPPVSAANGGAAGGFILELANGGAATVTWPAATKWPGGTAPSLTAAGIDILVFITDDGGTTWRGVQSMADSK
jgi:phage shock protein A